MTTEINPNLDRSHPGDSVMVKVTYPDGKGNHITTIADIKDRFKAEDPNWLTGFINEILGNGVAHTKFGQYDLIIE